MEYIGFFFTSLFEEIGALLSAWAETINSVGDMIGSLSYLMPTGVQPMLSTLVSVVVIVLICKLIEILPVL